MRWAQLAAPSVLDGSIGGKLLQASPRGRVNYFKNPGYAQI